MRPRFDGIQIMCESGICWNVSAAYMCEFKDVLQVTTVVTAVFELRYLMFEVVR